MNEYWKQRAKEENEDYETDSTRDDLKISLTDKQYNCLKLAAYKAGFESAGEFLSSFVGDLTGWHSNGSDERDFADRWYERAFGMSDYYSYFRYHLFNEDYSIDDMKDLIDDEDYLEETYQNYLAGNPRKTNQSKEDCLVLLKELIEKGEEL